MSLDFFSSAVTSWEQQSGSVLQPAEEFQSEVFTEGNTAFERTSVYLVWKHLILSVPCVQCLSACGQKGFSSGSHRRKYVGEKGLVWEWIGPGEKFCRRKWSAACESQRTTDVAHSTGKTNKCKGRCIPGNYSFARGILLNAHQALALGHCPAVFSLSVSVASWFFSTPSPPARDLQLSSSGNMPREQREWSRGCFRPEAAPVQGDHSIRLGCSWANSQLRDPKAQEVCGPAEGP